MLKKYGSLTNIIFPIVCLFLLLFGCQPMIDEDSTVVFITETISKEREVALFSTMTISRTRPISQTTSLTSTLLPLSTSFLTQQPTPMPTSSSTPQPSPVPLPSETVTPTPWPTLSPDEATDKVLTLLADNQNPDCLLPCWWGAVPGQTRWQDVKPFLRSFMVKIDETSRGASAKLPLPEAIAVPGFDYTVSYSWNELGIIRGISIKSINISGYDAKTMITLYGIPDEVWLKTFSEMLPGEVLPFQLIIVYQQQGISFRYYVNAERIGDVITACFEPGVVEIKRPDLFPAGPTIRVWEPGQYKEIEEIVNIPLETYYPLAEKTDLTPQTLYEKFVDPNEPPCIDTSAGLWINQ
ncbi:MAG: hypothetical protein H6658_00195 [Ardenticatenaceae bacterium]|nr:hypothetical protein [Ardenticatenaceae bacterium]